MKRIPVIPLLFPFIILMPWTAFGQELTLNDVRAGFSTAVQNEDSCRTLYKQLTRMSYPGTTWKGYLGAVTVSMSKYTSNPFRKLNYFNEGKQLIEEAVKQDPASVELRFLRFSVQEHVPGWLDYDANMAEDKKMILGRLDSLNMPRLKQAIIRYIAKSENFTQEEKKQALQIH